MLRWMRPGFVAGMLLVGLWLGQPSQLRAQDWNLNPYFYYPYHFFPHNYWPANSPVWPERPGEMYRKPPAYMAYPAFLEPHWRYDLFERKSHYRGFHFWLDSF